MDDRLTLKNSEIEITPQMVDAGEQVLEDHASHFETRALASMVYKAMELAKYRTSQD